MEIIVIFILSIVLLICAGLFFYFYKNNIKEKEEYKKEIQQKQDEFNKIKEEGDELLITTELLNEYKEFTEDKFRTLYDSYILLKQTGIANIINHPYASSDETVRAFLNAIYKFEPTFMSILTQIQNKSGDLFGTDTEEKKQ
jgi:uncharacterized protein YxeA